MNNLKTKTRLTYIDIARGIAILLVVMGHINRDYCTGIIWVFQIHKYYLLSILFTYLFSL